MSLLHPPLTLGIKALLLLLCRVDAEELAAVPQSGPAIVVVNHINFLEVPMLYTFFYPRQQTSFIKVETWRNPFLALLANTWNAIPIRRGAADTAAFAAAERELARGSFLLLAPEGTRSGDGRLRRGRPGVVRLAQRMEVPIIPVAHYGGETFRRNLRRLKRTDFRFRVGRPFYIRRSPEGISRAERQRVADEVMMRLAELLPAAYRGHYAAGISGGYRYLDFDRAAGLPAEGPGGSGGGRL
jgi:1-acyl-sn-glycerol-3-phosphate acyltransferase